MIKKNKGYYVYGTTSGGDCVHRNFYNNAVFFMDWIKRTMDYYERDMCKTQLWSKRASRKWIARVSSSGCIKGSFLCYKAFHRVFVFYVIIFTELVRFTGRCIKYNDNADNLNVVEETVVKDAQSCYKRCQNIDKVEPLFTACQYTEDDRKCKLIMNDNVHFGDGETLGAVCYVFHENKPEGRRNSLNYNPIFFK